MAPRLSRRWLRHRLVVAAGAAAAAAAVTVAEEPAVAAANATGVAEADAAATAAAAAITTGSHLPLTTVKMTTTMLTTGRIRCTPAGFGRGLSCHAIAADMEK